MQGGVYQSASYVGERWAEPVFAYYRAFDDVFEAEDAMRDAYGHGISRMLMLGGGGFAYPKFALMSHEGLRMDVIEYDGEITRLARRWFYLDELERKPEGLCASCYIGFAWTDAERTSAVFDLLLGDNLQGRKEHIAEHGAEYLDDLDVS